MKKSFDVYGVKVPVKYFEPRPENEHLLGYCSKEPIEIYINKSISGEKLKETCIHELIHSVFFRIGLDQVLTPEVNEMVTESVAKFIAENFNFKR